MSVTHIAPRRNPFSTARVRPGALPYQFPADTSAKSLIDKLAEQDWRGQIIGPHGSGKSTLLHSLVPLMREQRRVEWFTLSSSQRRLPVSREVQLGWSNSTVVVVDGYEQLSWRHRRRLRIRCRQRDCGLLVTSHSDAGFPTIYTTTASCETTQQLVQVLVSGSDRHPAELQIKTAFQACEGNVRETFFKLYDFYESQRLNRS
jgi:energy-coupling factor transporter ATP-binding protein EcfA2